MIRNISTIDGNSRSIVNKCKCMATEESKKKFVRGRLCGRKRCVQEIYVSRMGDSVHAGDKALTRVTPVQRVRVNRLTRGTGYLLFSKLCKNVMTSFSWYFHNTCSVSEAKSTLSNIYIIMIITHTIMIIGVT